MNERLSTHTQKLNLGERKKKRKLVSTSEEWGNLNLIPSPTEKLSENDIINKQSHWLITCPMLLLHPTIIKGEVTDQNVQLKSVNIHCCG